MNMMRDVLHELEPEMTILFDDGVVLQCIFARERGECRNNPHIGGHILISVKETNPLKVSAIVKKIIRKVLLRVVEGKLPRLSCKTNALRDWDYYVGYDDKASRSPPCAFGQQSALCTYSLISTPGVAHGGATSRTDR